MTEFQRMNRLDLIDALRSGEYQQGRYQLRTGDQFCCQGVGCDVFRRNTGTGMWEDGAFVVWDTYRSGGWAAGISEQYFGLTREDSDALMCMNDGIVSETYGISGGQFTFEEIADALELLTLAEL